MLAQEVARKYAHALFLLVQQKGVLDQADADMLALGKLVAADRTLVHFLDAPQVPDEQKSELVSRIFGPRVHRVVLEFLLLLVRKHRTRFLSEVIDEFDRQVKAIKGIGRVTVITAVPLSESAQTELAGKLARKTGLTIELEPKVDPAILGGMITILHDQIIDGSVRHGLGLIAQQLEKVKVA